MKTYAPKGLHGAMLRELLADLHATPLEVAKHLQVSERTVWRWLKEENAPFAVLAALWHETPRGRETGALDVGNALVIERGLARSLQGLADGRAAQLARLVAISDTGAANDALSVGPWSVRPVAVAVPRLVDVGPNFGKVGEDKGGQNGPADQNKGFAG